MQSVMSRPPTDDEKKLQRDVLNKYNKEDLIELLMLSQIDLWNVHVSSDKQNTFIKDIQKDLLKVINKEKGQQLSEQQLDDLLKMMQTVRGVAFSNNTVCDMNMNVNEAEFNAIASQLTNYYRSYSTAALWRRLKAACDDAMTAAVVVTNGKAAFKEAVIRKMVFEKLYHERKDREVGRRCGRLQIAEIKDRERRNLLELRQQIRAIREGRGFTVSPCSIPPYVTPFQTPYGTPITQVGAGFHSPLNPSIPSITHGGMITPFWKDPYTFQQLQQHPYGIGKDIFTSPYGCGIGKDVFSPYGKDVFTPYGIGKDVFSPYHPYSQWHQQQCGVPPYYLGAGQMTPFPTHAYPFTSFFQQPYGHYNYNPSWYEGKGYCPTSTTTGAYPHHYPSSFGHRQSPDYLHDYCSEDYDDNEWEADNDDLLHREGEDYENDGFMVPEYGRFLVGKQEMKRDEYKIPSKKTSKKGGEQK